MTAPAYRRGVFYSNQTNCTNLKTALLFVFMILSYTAYTPTLGIDIQKDMKYRMACRIPFYPTRIGVFLEKGTLFRPKGRSSFILMPLYTPPPRIR